MKAFKYAFYIFLVIIGFYLNPNIGVRTDHIIVYGLFIYVLLYFIILQRPIALNQELGAILLIIFLILVLGVISAFINNNVIFSSVFLSDFDRFFFPFATIIVTSYFFYLYYSNPSNRQKFELLNNLIDGYLIFILFNTIFAASLLYFDLTLIKLHLGGPMVISGQYAEPLNMVMRSVTAGRSGGVFSQPVEAGVALTIALLLWIYRTNNNKSLKSLSIINLFMIFIGGYFSGSKVFYLLGVPLFIISSIFTLQIVKIFNLKIIFIILIMVVVSYFVYINWDGIIPLTRTNQTIIYLRILDFI